MMRLNNINQLKTSVLREDLLKKLKENLERHQRIVAENKAGYVREAKKLLQARLAAFGEGKTPNLHFDLQIPQDYSTIYKTVIEMMEWNSENHVLLSADEFRQLVQDEWDWQSAFLDMSKKFSETAEQYASARHV